MKAFVAGKEVIEKNDFFEELRLLQISCGFGKPLRLYIALEALFGDNLSSKTFEEHKELIAHQGKMMNCGEILWAFELYLHVHTGLGKAYAFDTNTFVICCIKISISTRILFQIVVFS